MLRPSLTIAQKQEQKPIFVFVLVWRPHKKSNTFGYKKCSNALINQFKQKWISFLLRIGPQTKTSLFAFVDMFDFRHYGTKKTFWDVKNVHFRSYPNC